MLCCVVFFFADDVPCFFGSGRVSSGEALTAEKLTNMLRGGGHLPNGVSVKSLEKVALALHNLISTAYPRDSLYVLGFSALATEI